MRPSGQHAEQEQDEHDQENSSKSHSISFHRRRRTKAPAAATRDRRLTGVESLCFTVRYYSLWRDSAMGYWPASVRARPRTRSKIQDRRSKIRGIKEGRCGLSLPGLIGAACAMRVVKDRPPYPKPDQADASFGEWTQRGSRSESPRFSFSVSFSDSRPLKNYPISASPQAST